MAYDPRKDSHDSWLVFIEWKRELYTGGRWFVSPAEMYRLESWGMIP